MGRGRLGIRTPTLLRARSFIFHVAFQMGPGVHPASCTMGTGLSSGVKAAGVAADTHPQLQPRLRNTFMAY